MLPIGLQLEDVRLGPDNNATIRSTRPRLFIPHSSIRDCVVVEVVLAHRVRDTVVLRRKNAQMPQVELFPRVDLTYQECLQLRNVVNAYIKDAPQI